jgi:hypothetical protein
MRPRNPNPKGPQGHPGAGEWAKVLNPAEWEGNFRFEGTRGPPWWAGRSRRASGGSGGAARRSAPARAGAGWGEEDLGRGIETQGRSESRPAARHGGDSGLVGGARPRGRATRGGRAETVDWQRFTEQAKSRTRRCPHGPDAQASGSAGFRWGSSRAVLLSQGSRAQPLRRQEHPVRFAGPSYGRASARWRAMVAVEVRATGRSIPIRDAMWSLPCFGR